MATEVAVGGGARVCISTTETFHVSWSGRCPAASRCVAAFVIRSQCMRTEVAAAAAAAGGGGWGLALPKALGGGAAAEGKPVVATVADCFPCQCLAAGVA